MFKHIVMLKNEPWFIRAASAEDAISIAKSYGYHLVGIAVHTPDGIDVTKPEHATVLKPIEVKQIAMDPYREEKIKEPFFDEVEQEEIDDALELDDSGDSKEAGKAREQRKLPQVPGNQK